MMAAESHIDSAGIFDPQKFRGDESEKQTANDASSGEASTTITTIGVMGSASKERRDLDEEKKKDSQSKKKVAEPVDDAEEGNMDPPSSLLHHQTTHGKRRNLGRAARRRRRKFLDIQQREEEIIRQQQQQEKEEGNNSQKSTSYQCIKESSSSSSSVIPVDRDKVWPAVAQLRRQFASTAVNTDTHDGNSGQQKDTNNMMDAASTSGGWRGATDERALIGQLGFLPGNAIRVSARVRDLRKQNNRPQEQQQEQDDSTPTKHAVKGLLLASSSSPPQSSNNKNDYHDVLLDEEDDHVPVVLQLYPLVLRDEYAGGKSDGRKFKSRKRLRNKMIENQPTDKDTNGGGDDDDVAISSNSATSKAPRQEEEEIPDTNTEPSSSPSSLTNNNNTEATTVVVEPFPTIYWLTHPFLRVWISRLELDGLGVRLEQRLAAPANEAALERMKHAHEAYAQERMALLTESDRALVQSRHWDDALLKTNRGVAGVRNPRAVKCLHAHAAHYLSGGWGCHDNVIGEWVMQEVHKMLHERNKKPASGDNHHKTD